MIFALNNMHLQLITICKCILCIPIIMKGMCDVILINYHTGYNGYFRKTNTNSFYIRM